MTDEKTLDIMNLSKDQFEFVSEEGRLHDQKLDTKPVGYLRDAMKRFAKNKSSVVAAVIIGILIVFAIFGTLFCNKAYQNAYTSETVIKRYRQLLPKISAFEGSGFWDGSEKKEVALARYYIYQAMAQETGYNPIQKIVKTEEVGLGNKKSTIYYIRVDSYYANPVFTLTLTPDEYARIQAWQDETGLQVILPRVNEDLCPLSKTDKSIWYVSDAAGYPLDSNGKAIKKEGATLIPAYIRGAEDGYTSRLRISGDPGIENPASAERYSYAQVTGAEGQDNYVVRISPYNYFQYKFGFKPSFIFGTDARGFDIISRLASQKPSQQTHNQKRQQVQGIQS